MGWWNRRKIRILKERLPGLAARVRMAQRKGAELPVRAWVEAEAELVRREIERREGQETSKRFPLIGLHWLSARRR